MKSRTKHSRRPLFTYPFYTPEKTFFLDVATKTGIHIGYFQFYDKIMNYAIQNNLIRRKPEIDVANTPISKHVKELTLLLSVQESQHNHELVSEMPKYVNHIIVHDIEAVPRDVLKSPARVHLVDNDITTNGGLSDATITKIEEIHEQQQLDKDILREHRGGRPPIGTTVQDGYLVKSDEYEAVCRVLKQYRNDNASAEGAANALDTSQKTISNAASRDALYQLQ